MVSEEVSVEAERGHADVYRFTYTAKDGTITGRVSVTLEGRPDTGSREEKMRAARIKVEHLAHSFATAITEKRFAGRM